MLWWAIEKDAGEDIASIRVDHPDHKLPKKKQKMLLA
jgi:hypothetical protein